MDSHRAPVPAWDRPNCSVRSATGHAGLHYSIGTEQAYVDGVRRFILYLPKALHPCNPGSSCSTGSGIRRRGGRWKWKRFRRISRSMSTSRRPARTGR